MGSTTGSFEAIEQPEAEWQCTHCRAETSYRFQQCSQCGAPRPLLREPGMREIPTPAWERAGKFNVLCAVDFGTDGTAIAVSVKGSERVGVKRVWETMSGEKNQSQFGHKTSTSIILDEKDQVVSFGDDAVHQFANKKFIQGSEKWRLYEKFKMCLWDGGEEEDEKGEKVKVEIKKHLLALNGERAKTETVIVEALKYVKHNALCYLEELNIAGAYSSKEIQWVLTVPAIWSDKSKALMREWAIAAGMIEEGIEDQLIIALEPECASMCMCCHLKDKSASLDIRSGDKYLLLDLGGGTCDIACHEVVGEYQVAEVQPASGGAFGSVYIDAAFLDLMNRVFGKKVLSEFAELHPDQWLQFRREFTTLKSEFLKKPMDQQRFKQNPKRLMRSFFSVTVPLGLCEWIEERCGPDVEALVEDFETECGTNMLRWDNSAIALKTQLMISLFETVVHRIVEQTRELLTQFEAKCIAMVGGLSQSWYVQHRIISQFGPESKFGAQVVLPPEPLIAVVEGAARLGMVRSFVKQRITRKTYGVQYASDVLSALARGVPKEHIEENLAGPLMVRKCFKAFVKKGEKVEVDQVVADDFTTPGGDQMVIPVMCSEEENPVISTGCDELCKIEVPLPEHCRNKDIKVKFYFGESMIRVVGEYAGEMADIRLNYDFDD